MFDFGGGGVFGWWTTEKYAEPNVAILIQNTSKLCVALKDGRITMSGKVDAVLCYFWCARGGRRKALNCRLELTFPGKNAAKSKKCVCMKTRKTSKWLCVLSSEFLSPKIVLNKRQKSNSQMNTHKIFKWSRRACVSFFFSSYWMKNYGRAVVNAWHTWRIFVQQIALCVGEHASPSQKSSVWKK